MRPVLMTAGATRNKVDAIRFLTAHAGGGTALELLLGIQAPGLVAQVLGNPEAVLRVRLAQAEGVLKIPVLGEEYFGTRDLLERMRRWVTENPGGVVVHSAAVGDYEPEVTGTKIPSGQAEVLLRLTPAPKILDQLRGFGLTGPLVSFKAGRPGLTPDELEAIARAQLQRTQSDLVFANVIGSLQSSVLLVGPQETTAYPDRRDAIHALASRLRAWISAYPSPA